MFHYIIPTMSIIALCTASPASTMQPPAISLHKLPGHSENHIHNMFAAHSNELLRRVVGAQDQLARRIQVQEEANCPGTPFLWKIIENDTGSHVGFAVGTAHLPADIVLTEEAFGSIISAVVDSCDVYGESNLYDNNTMHEIAECQASAGKSATLADIPDEGLREEIQTKLVEIIIQQYDITPENAEIIASRFYSLPYTSVEDFIAYANTPEYMDKYADDLFNGLATKVLDMEILALGRPAASLEEVSTQCNIIQALNPSAEVLNETFALDPDAFSSIVRNSLNASYSVKVELYKCGDVDAFVEFDTVNSDPEFDLLMSGRNEQMAAKIDEVLKASDPDKKILFAVGLAHWLLRSNNMISLLEDYGYSMEHIPYWNKTQLDNPSNDFCGVLYNPEAGIFVADSSIGTVPSDTAPTPSGEGNDASTTPTKMPAQGDVKEVATESATASVSDTTAGIVMMVIGWSSFVLWYV